MQKDIPNLDWLSLDLSKKSKSKKILKNQSLILIQTYHSATRIEPIYGNVFTDKDLDRRIKN